MSQDVLEVDLIKRFDSLEDVQAHIERLKKALPNFHVANVEVSITFKENL